MKEKIKKALEFLKFDLKKLILFILTLFGSLFLYILIPYTGDEFFGLQSAVHFGILTLLFVLTNISLIWCFFYKKRKNIYLIIISSLILIHSLMLLIPSDFPDCSSYSFFSRGVECDCIGIEKNYFFRSECIGFISDKYPENSKEKNPIIDFLF